jgi:hypothetical protein
MKQSETVAAGHSPGPRSEFRAIRTNCTERPPCRSEFRITGSNLPPRCLNRRARRQKEQQRPNHLPHNTLRSPQQVLPEIQRGEEQWKQLPTPKTPPPSAIPGPIAKAHHEPFANLSSSVFLCGPLLSLSGRESPPTHQPTAHYPLSTTHCPQNPRWPKKKP